MIVDECTTLDLIKKSKKIALVEPNYTRKYLPLGLAKISSYAKSHGNQVNYIREISDEEYDLYCVTTLFTYYSKQVFQVLDAILEKNPSATVIVGGIFASLMPGYIDKLYPSVNIFVGYSRELDVTMPDYSIDYGITDDWNSYSYLFTSRGCVNNCAYCAVPRIEDRGKLWINPIWKDLIVDFKKKVMISDNNLTAAPQEHFDAVIEELRRHNKPVLFNNGVDNKFVTEENAKKLASIRYTTDGLRLAFDRIEEDGVFQEAVEKLKKNGVNSNALFAFVLFNFTDTPQEAYYRFNECLRLGVRPYPQRFTRLNILSKSEVYVGKYWTPRLVQAFRKYCLMGYFRKYSFERYFTDINTDKYIKLSPEDWDKWYYKK